MNINVLGLGYIGLPTAALLASHGFRVFGTDINKRAVDTINSGRVHIIEPDLDSYVKSSVESGRLTAHLNPQLADIYMICVPTPFERGEGIPSPDLTYVKAAIKSIAALIKVGDSVILESTSPVGTTQEIHKILDEYGIDMEKVSIAYCPERVLPGKIMAELTSNNRIVGGLNSKSTKVVADFYRKFVQGNVLETDAKTAEMCKLTENSYRDVNIAFSNEISIVCENMGINVWELIRLANLHPRVDILSPGPGVGGHCIAVDPWFIVSSDPKNTPLIQSARGVNTSKTDWVVDQIIKRAATSSVKSGGQVRIACLGLAFKPDIDDLRESPAMLIALRLMEIGYDVVAVEPNITECSSLVLVPLQEALDNADVVVILVKHQEFIIDDARKILENSGALDFCGALS